MRFVGAGSCEVNGSLLLGRTVALEQTCFNVCERMTAKSLSQPFLHFGVRMIHVTGLRPITM